MERGILKAAFDRVFNNGAIWFKPAAAVIAALFFFTASMICSASAAGEPGVTLPAKHTLRPISKFKVVMPFADVSKIFENNRMVMIDYDELDELVEKNNRMLAERYKTGVPKEKRPPADYIINSASYKFVKDHDNVLCGLDMDFSVLAEDRFVLVPLVGGSLALSDAVIDDTIPVIISEPLAAKGEDDTAQQVRQAIDYQQNNINAEPVIQTNDPNYGAPPALMNNIAAPRRVGSGVAASRYSLLVGKKGRHTLSLRFLLTPRKDGAQYSFFVLTPNSPKNSVLFMHDAADAVIRMTPAIGERLFTHPETKKQAFEADFGFSDRLHFTYYAITPEEKMAIETATAPDGSAVTGEAALSGDTLETAAAPAPPEKYEAEPAAVSCNVKSVYSIGDGLIRGSHDITFNIIKGQLSKFSFETPVATEVDEVLTDNYDKRQIRQVRTPGGAGDYSSVEVFLKYPATNEFNLTITTLTRIEDGTFEVDMPSMRFQGVESERGHIAVCALTNVKIGLAREPFNLERIDAQELPERIKFSVVSPILFAFKYFKHPYRARLALTKYSDSDVLASVLTSSSVNTFITGQGRAVSSCEFHIKNNGMPFLKLLPDDTVEILDGALVKGKLVKVSYDQDANFKIPIVKSDYRNDDILEYPIRFKTSAETSKLGMAGGVTLRMPRAEVPSMHFKWRVYTADGYMFYNVRGTPDLKQTPAVPLIYQIPLNFINAVAAVYRSPHAASFFIISFVVIIMAFIGYVIYMGGEKACQMGVFSAVWNFVYNLFARIFSFFFKYALSLTILFVVFAVLAAISVPNFNRARHQARSKSCVANMKTIEGAVELYRMENGGVPSIDVYTLQNRGYLKGVPQCPEGYGYQILMGDGAGVMTDVICPRHGRLSMQENTDKTKGIGAPSDGGFASRSDYDAAPATSMAPPAPQMLNEAAGEAKSEMAPAEDESDYGAPSKPGAGSRDMKFGGKARTKKTKVTLEDRIRAEGRARQESRGIFSVPIALPKTGHSTVVEKRFVMSGEEVTLKLSYMSVKLYRALLALLVFMGLLIPFAASRALFASEGAPVFVLAALSLLLALEAANAMIPETAGASQLGILAGVIIFAMSKTIAKLSNPRVLARLVDMLNTPVTSVETAGTGVVIPAPPSRPGAGPSSATTGVSTQADNAGKSPDGKPSGGDTGSGPSSGGGGSDKKPDGGGPGPKINLVIFLLLAFAFQALLLAPVSADIALAAPGDGGERRIELGYNPSTLEVQTFYLLDMAMRPNEKKVMIPYNDLKYLIDSVNSMEYTADSRELTAPAAPPYRAMIKKASLTGAIGLDSASLTIEYFIDVFDDDYTGVDLIGGDIALTAAESYLIKPYNFGFYGMSDNYIDKFERAYSSKGDRERITRYRQAKSFDTVSRYESFKVNPSDRKYNALFEDPGEYMVRVSFKTNVIFNDNSYYFNLYPARSACMKVSLSTPAEYDLLADNMIVESRSKEGDGASARNITSGGLIPADAYSFRLTLAEQARRERERARLEEERRLREARERLLAQKSEEVTVITKKIEPRVTLVSACRLTVDEERFSGLADWNYNIQNTEVRELSYEIPRNTMITLVEGAGVYDWKVTGGDGNGGFNGAQATAEAAVRRELKVMFKNPVRGAVNLKIGFETEIFDMKAPVCAPFIRPSGADEYKGFLAIDSAVNAEVSVTGEVETNLVPIDEKEIPGLPAGYASSSVLFAYKFSKEPDNLFLEVKKHIDIAAIPCAIDVANYKTFVTREGNIITSAYYVVRNNNVQFLELKLPAGSTPWSLKVGERMFKPGSGADGVIYIPLLKSPDDGQNFLPFAVSLVYFTKAPAFGAAGSGRFELPRPGVLCSKVNWEVHFIDEYNMFNISTNLRRQDLNGADSFMERSSAAGRGGTVSIDQMLDMQYKKMAVTNMKQISGAVETPGEQTRVSAPSGPGSGAGGGAAAKSRMPVSIAVPSTTNVQHFTVESLEKINDLKDATVFYIKFSYYSKPIFDLLTFFGYALGVALVLTLLIALFKTGSYRPVLAVFIVSAVYVSALEYITGGTAQYFMFGFVMAALLYAAHLIVRLNEEERRFLKLK